MMVDDDGPSRDLRDSALDSVDLDLHLASTWRTDGGLWAALSTVDHKIVGRRYIITAFVFLFLGGILSLLMRLQLSQPEARFIGPDRYNQIFTMHGTNMMFLFAVPVMEAMAVYLVPLMVGTRNIAFPASMHFPTGCFLPAESCCGWPLRSTPVPMLAGSHMCRLPGRNMAPASGPISGRR